MLLRAGLIPLTLFSLTACETTRETVPIRPDLDNPARLVCEAAPERPAIPATYSIDWSKVKTVEQARGEYEAYVRSIIARNGVVAGHIVEIEDRLFVCSNNAQWWRDYWARLPD